MTVFVLGLQMKYLDMFPSRWAKFFVLLLASCIWNASRLDIGNEFGTLTRMQYKSHMQWDAQWERLENFLGSAFCFVGAIFESSIQTF